MKIKAKPLIVILGVALTLLLLLFSFSHSFLSLSQTVTAGLVLIAIILFATSTFPEHVTALLFMTSTVLLGLAPANVVFSGFYSTACWLIFSGLIIGIALKTTGLAQRVADLFSESLTSHYWKVISTTVIISTLLGFLMPSSLGRAVLLVPIAMAVAEQCGFTKDSNGQIGIALAVAFGCHVPTFAVLPANVPNMVLIGAAETIHNWTPSYTEYLILHFPILGLLKTFIIIALILWFYPDKPNKTQAHRISTPYSKDQIKLIVILFITLGFWITDQLHHISAAWIGLSAACFLLLPGIGLVNKKSFDEQFKVAPLIFVVGILALGAVVNESGLGKEVGDRFIRWLPLSEEKAFSNYILLALTSTVTGILTTLPGVPAVMTPFAEQISQQTGLSIESVIMLQVLGFSTIVFPFQSAPLVVAMQLAGVSLKHAAKLCLVLSTVTIVLLFPLDYLWWRWVIPGF